MAKWLKALGFIVWVVIVVLVLVGAIQTGNPWIIALSVALLRLLSGTPEISGLGLVTFRIVMKNVNMSKGIHVGNRQGMTRVLGKRNPGRWKDDREVQLLR